MKLALPHAPTPETSPQASATPNQPQVEHPLAPTQKLSRSYQIMLTQAEVHEKIIESLAPEIPTPPMEVKFTEKEFMALTKLEGRAVGYLTHCFNALSPKNKAIFKKQEYERKMHQLIEESCPKI